VYRSNYFNNSITNVYHTIDLWQDALIHYAPFSAMFSLSQKSTRNISTINPNITEIIIIKFDINKRGNCMCCRTFWQVIRPWLLHSSLLWFWCEACTSVQLLTYIINEQNCTMLFCSSLLPRWNKLMQFIVHHQLWPDFIKPGFYAHKIKPTILPEMNYYM